MTVARTLNRGSCQRLLSSTVFRRSTASHTSTKRSVQRGEPESEDVRPTKIADHASFDQRLDDRVAVRRANERYLAAPFTGSRGDARARPCPSQRDSTSATKRSVSAIDLSRIAPSPPAASAAITESTPHSSADSETIGGVPHRNRDCPRRRRSRA